MVKAISDMKNIEKIQSLLPIGYLYLVLLGIIKETTFFYQLDINILKFSSIMDILISPISTLTSHPWAFIAFTTFFVFINYLPTFLFNHGHKNWVKKGFYLKKSKEDLPDDELKTYYQIISVQVMAIVLLVVYLGYGFVEGHSTKNRNEANQLDYDYRINFNSGDPELVHLLENNSVYYFYIAKGSKSVKMAPIGSIKNVELINNTEAEQF